MSVCVSLPVHEQPAVVLDQVENLRAFLGEDTVVVLHLSRAMGADPADVASRLPDGVHVNPVAQATAWGDVLHLHNANVRFALDHLGPFDHVLLHASNDLYVRPGAATRIEDAQAGFLDWTPESSPGWGGWAPALADPMLAAILADVGTDTPTGGLCEGTFYATDLMREILDRVERHFVHGEGAPYPREELYYQSIAAVLAAGPLVPPIVYTDVSDARPRVSPGLVAGLVDGTFAASTRRPGRRDLDYDHVYAVKRVARELHDPTRAYVRALAHATGRRLRLPPPFEARAFVALAFAADVLADPTLVAAWQATFGAEDDATLAILLERGDEHLVPEVVAAVERAPGDADMTLVTVEPGSFEQASLRWAVDVVLRPDGADAPPFLDTVPLAGPASAAALKSFAAR